MNETTRIIDMYIGGRVIIDTRLQEKPYYRSPAIDVDGKGIAIYASESAMNDYYGEQFPIVLGPDEIDIVIELLQDAKALMQSLAKDEQS